MEISQSKFIRVRGEDVVWREDAGEIVILDLATSTYLTLNGSGKDLWIKLTKGSTIGALSKLLEDTYLISPGRATSDAEIFVSSLLERGLVDLSDSAD